MGGSAEARPSELGGLAVVVRLQVEGEPGPRDEPELAKPEPEPEAAEPAVESSESR
jgi:hypothetical protein